MDLQSEYQACRSDVQGNGSMKFKDKNIRVILVDEAKESFLRLQLIVAEERQNVIYASLNQTLFKSIEHKIVILKKYPEYGVHIPRNRIPGYYLKQYDISNLWKINLAGAWRMIYTIKGSHIEVVAVILDIFSYKAYDKKFGYRKR
jgi:plasmid maintenance system killer protein